MRQILTLLAFALLLGHGSASAAAEPGPTEEPLFIVHFTTGPSWAADKPFPQQQHAADHSANLRRLRDLGVLVLGGRHGATGMIVLRSPSIAAARAQIEQDPSVGVGVFAYTIEEFRPFYGGCINTAPPPPVAPQHQAEPSTSSTPDPS